MLDGQQWYDAVYWLATPGAIKSGDRVETTEGTYICLGKTIAFPELYNPETLPTLSAIVDRTPHFLSSESIALIHRMASTYYAAYKHTIALFPIKFPTRTYTKTPASDKVTEQSCHLFPDLRSLTQTIPPATLVAAREKNSTVAILHGWLTVTQKRAIYEGVRLGAITTVYATSRGLFLPRSHLKHILLHASHARAYSNQSEPRFVIQQVAEKWAEAYGAGLECVG